MSEAPVGFIPSHALGFLVPRVVGESALRRRWGCESNRLSPARSLACRPLCRNPSDTRDSSRFRHAAAGLLLLIVLLPLLSVGAGATTAAPPNVATAASRSIGIDHPTRMKILAHLVAVPGDHYTSIARCLRVGRAETRHHLNVLMRRGQVREERQGGHLRYYANDDASADRNAMFGAYWQLRECRVRVLRFVEDRKAARPCEVAAGLGISRQLADYHLQVLAASGLLTRDRGRYRT